MSIQGPRPGPRFFAWYVWHDLFSRATWGIPAVILVAVTLSYFAGSLAVGLFEGDDAVRRKRMEREPLNLCIRLSGRLHEGSTIPKMLEERSWKHVREWLEKGQGAPGGRPRRFDLYQILDSYQLIVPNAIASDGQTRIRCRTLRESTDGSLDPWYKIREWETDRSRAGPDRVKDWNGVILTRSFVDDRFGKGAKPLTVAIEFIPGNLAEEIPVLGILTKDLPDDVNVLIPERFLDQKLAADEDKQLTTVRSGPVPSDWPRPNDSELAAVLKAHKLTANEPLAEFREANAPRVWYVSRAGGLGLTKAQWVAALASLEEGLRQTPVKASPSPGEEFSEKLDLLGESTSSARPRGNLYHAVAWFSGLQGLKQAADALDRLRQDSDARRPQIRDDSDANVVLFNREVVERIALLDEIVRNTRYTMSLGGVVGYMALCVALGMGFYQRLHAQRAAIGMLRVMGIGPRVVWIGLLEGLVLGTLGILGGFVMACALGSLPGSWQYPNDAILARISFSVPIRWWWWRIVIASVGSFGILLALVTSWECRKSPSLMMREDS